MGLHLDIVLVFLRALERIFWVETLGRGVSVLLKDRKGIYSPLPPLGNCRSFYFPIRSSDTIFRKLVTMYILEADYVRKINMLFHHLGPYVMKWKDTHPPSYEEVEGQGITDKEEITFTARYLVPYLDNMVAGYIVSRCFAVYFK